MTISIALIVAAGRGYRASIDLPKQYVMLGNIPMLRHVIEKFITHRRITHVIIVVHPDDICLYKNAIDGLDILPPAFGGDERHISVRNGIEEIAALKPDNILIHDAARPFISHKLIDDLLDALDNHDGVIPALPVIDCVKRSNNDKKIINTLTRQNLWLVQTPQAFKYQKIRKAHDILHNMGETKNIADDAAVFEAANMPVKIINGDQDNFKITTKDDIIRANEKMLKNKDKLIKYPRIGSGFDVHKFCDGDFITLCGVKIPHNMGLAGHSDADVALHALTDAMLGVIANGDIGLHFPPSDEKWHGANSKIFIKHSLELIKNIDGEISNIDITIICENPKITPYRDLMRQSLAKMLDMDISRISIKATTTEKLGFTGRGEGIAAQASILVMLP